MLNVLDFVFPVLLSISMMVNIVMTLVLWKGQICPGQRRRLMRQGKGLTLLWIITLVCGTVSLENSVLILMVAVAGITFEYSRHQPVRARSALLTSGLASALAMMTALLVLPLKVVLLISMLTSGAAIAQLLMISARCRLQAFYRILPATGFIGILIACGEAVRTALSDKLISVEYVQYATSGALLMLVAAFVIWVWPAFHKEKPTVGRLSIVSSICVISNLFNSAINYGVWI